MNNNKLTPNELTIDMMFDCTIDKVEQKLFDFAKTQVKSIKSLYDINEDFNQFKKTLSEKWYYESDVNYTIKRDFKNFLIDKHNKLFGEHSHWDVAIAKIGNIDYLVSTKQKVCSIFFDIDIECIAQSPQAFEYFDEVEEEWDVNIDEYVELNFLEFINGTTTLSYDVNCGDLICKDKNVYLDYVDYDVYYNNVEFVFNDKLVEFNENKIDLNEHIKDWANEISESLENDNEFNFDLIEKLNNI